MFAGRVKVGVRLAAVVVGSVVTLAAVYAGESPVADAAQRGDVEEVRSLLRQGADANAAQADGMTGLHWAALNGGREIAEVLLFAGATVQPTTRLGGYTPLHLASQSGHADVVEALLVAGADPNRVTSTGVTAMHFAAEANAAGAIRSLVEHGGDVDSPDSFSARTPLMFAAVRNATDAMKVLVDVGADVSVTTEIKDYELISRAASEDRSRRNRIRNAAEDPDENPRGRSARGGRGGPPNAAAGRGQPGAPGAAAGRGRGGPPSADPVTPPDSTATPPAASPGAATTPEPAASDPAVPPAPVYPTVRSLSSTQQIGKQGGFAALHYAVRDGQAEAAQLLLDAGADVDQVTEGDMSSPLLVAVINGHYDIAKELLDRGADPNLVSDDGAGPLFATLNIEWSLRTWYPQPAAFRKQGTSYLELMELLLEAGADPNARTSTHIWYAAYNAGRMGVDFTGATPFWRAAYAADVTAMRLLASYGADPNLWTYNLGRGGRGPVDPDVPGNPANQEPEPADPSGLPPVPNGGPGIHPLHAASGVGFGTSRVAQQHRHVPDGWLAAVQYFVDELGVDPNLRDKDGFTAVHHSAARGDNETILYLVSRGADVTLISRRGQTTADLANSPEQRAQPHPATVALLEKLGSKNNHQCRSCGGG